MAIQQTWHMHVTTSAFELRLHAAIAADNSCQEPKVISNTPAFLLSHICLAKWESQILVISKNLVCMPSNCLQNILIVE